MKKTWEGGKDKEVDVGGLSDMIYKKQNGIEDRIDR